MTMNQDIENNFSLSLFEDTIAGGIIVGYREPGFPLYYIGKQTLNYFGYSSKEAFVEATGGLIDNNIHPDDLTRAVATCERELRQGSKCTLEYRFKKADGSYLWVKDYGKKQVLENGREIVVSIIYDINEKKLLEQENLDTQKQFEQLVNVIPGGIGTYQMIGDKLVNLFYSPGILKLTGYSASEYEAIAKKDALEMVYEDDRKKIITAMKKKIINQEEMSFSLRIYHHSKGLLWIHVGASVIGKKEGKLVVQAVFMAMSKESRLYYDIANKATNGIYVIDKQNYELLYTNHKLEEAVSYYGFANLLGQRCHQVLRGEKNPCEDCMVNESPREQSRIFYNRHFGRHYAAVSRDIKWAGHDAVVVYINDITEEKRANNEIKQIYNNIPGAIYRCRDDEGWTVLSANDGLFTFLGYSRKEFVAMGGKMAAIIYPDDYKVMKDKVSHQLANGQTSLEGEERLICKNGHIKWVSIKAQLIHENEQQYFYCVFVDITKQKEEELQIIELEKNLAAAFNHARMVYWEYDLLKESVEINETIQRLFNLPPLLKDYPESFLKQGFVLEEHQQSFRDGIKRIKEGVPYVEFEARIKTLKQNYQWVRIRFNGIKNESGVVVRVLCTGEIISEYKELETRFMATMYQNNISSWMYNIERHSIMLRSNNNYAFGQTDAKEILNVPESQIASGLCHRDDVELLRDTYRRVNRGEKQVVTKLRFRDSKTKTYRWKKFTYTIIQEYQGMPLQALGSSIDIDDEIQEKHKYELAVEYRKHILVDNLLLSGRCSVTKDRIMELTDLTKTDLIKRFSDKRDDFFVGLKSLIVDSGEKKKFESLFSNKGVIYNFERGINEAKMSCAIRFNEASKDFLWVDINAYFIRVPRTNDIEGFLTIVDCTKDYIKNKVLNAVIEFDYDYVANVNLTSDKLTLYQSDNCDLQFPGYQFGEASSYQAGIQQSYDNYVVANEREMYLINTNPNKIRSELKDKNFYEFIYHVEIDGKIKAKQLRYSSYDAKSDSVIFSKADITKILAVQETQKEELQASLALAKKANQAKSDFLSRVSHDMRTPLNGILGLTTLMKEKKDWSQIQSDLIQLELSGQYLLNLINDTLDVSKIENGKMKLNPSVCDGKMVFENALTLLKPNLDEKEIDFKVHVKDISSTMLYLDIGRAEQLIMNIVGNAIKFTPKKGKIEFVLEKIEETLTHLIVQIVVKDNGVGMDPEYLPHIFEPFSQENTNKTSQYQGTGLGMTICQQIVSLVDGTIEVKSEPDQGTEFILTLKLPKATPEQIENWQQAVPMINLDILKNKRILLCEDHPLNAQIAKRLLVKQGILVELAKNGQVGVTMFMEKPVNYYDAILMDIRMPLMDGHEATRQIRLLSREDAKTIPIIAMTANALNDDVLESRMAGMDGHISKPVEVDILYQTLASLIATK